MDTNQGSDGTPSATGLRAGRGRAARPQVILIHGIRTRAGWIDESIPILEPFFEVVPIRFGDYLHLGALKLALDPLLLGTTAVTALGVRLVARGAPWYLPPLLAAAGLYASRRSAIARLEGVIEQFVRRYHTVAGGPAHVVAHSLGSFIIGNSLLRYPAVRYRKVILYGCVLPQEFDWGTVPARDNPRFWTPRVEGVWNEVATGDPVPQIADVLGRYLKVPFGGAGCYGFTGDDVHDRTAHNEACPACAASSRASIHNIRSPLGHSDAFYGAGHCRLVWRPYLLGYDPAEYAYLLRLCRLVHEAFERDQSLADVFDKELAETEWDWCGGQLSARTITMLKAQSSHVSEAELWILVDRVRAEFWLTIALAQLTEARARETNLDSDDLDPVIVLHNSVRRVLDANG